MAVASLGLRIHRSSLRPRLRATVASTTLMMPMSRAFARQIEQFAQEHDFDIIGFGKGEPQDGITHQYLRRFDKSEGVLYIGKAQEKFSPFRVENASVTRPIKPFLCCFKRNRTFPRSFRDV
jgi:hypothetical protein